MNQWKADCLEWRVCELNGYASHWCADWDDLPIDEWCVEYPCACVPLPWLVWWQRPIVWWRSWRTHRAFNAGKEVLSRANR